MPVKDELTSSNEVMTIMGVALEPLKPVDNARIERTLKIGSTLTPDIKNGLVRLLKEFKDVFA